MSSSFEWLKTFRLTFCDHARRLTTSNSGLTEAMILVTELIELAVEDIDPTRFSGIAPRLLLDHVS